MTGKYCSSIFSPSTNATVNTDHNTCSDCALGIQQLELNSTFGFRHELADSFAWTTSKCGKHDYQYTKPALAIFDQPRPTLMAAIASSVCSRSYEIKEKDTCNSVALAHDISVFSLLQINGLQAYCRKFPKAGQTICLPKRCNTYTVKANQTCMDIIGDAPGDFNLAQLQAWNPNINKPCSNLYQLVGSQICVRSAPHLS